MHLRGIAEGKFIVRESNLFAVIYDSRARALSLLYGG